MKLNLLYKMIQENTYCKKGFQGALDQSNYKLLSKQNQELRGELRAEI